MTIIDRACTLIESLVAFSILALLAAMLLSTIGIVRTASLKDRCGGNQRQAAIAALAYAGEWQGLLAADKRILGETAADSQAWFLRLPAYLDLPDAGTERTVLHCPAWRMPAGAAPPPAAAYPRSLKQNDYLDFDPATREYQYSQAVPANRHYRLGSASDQTELLLFADGATGRGGTAGYGPWGRLQQGIVDFRRHRGGAVGIALDGHLLTAATAADFRWVSSGWPAP